MNVKVRASLVGLAEGSTGWAYGVGKVTATFQAVDYLGEINQCNTNGLAKWDVRYLTLKTSIL